VAQLAVDEALVPAVAEADAGHGRRQALLSGSPAPLTADGGEAEAVFVGRETAEDEAGDPRARRRRRVWQARLAEARTHDDASIGKDEIWWDRYRSILWWLYVQDI
jgi:hypothetical protein